MATSCEDPPSRFQNLKRIFDRLPEQWNRRALRKAVRSSDLDKVKTIIGKGHDVNAVVSDVFQDTALTWSVKNGHLEVVEFLVNIPGCDMDKKDRNHHSPLDEAIKRWLSAAVAAAPAASNSVCSHRDNDTDMADFTKTEAATENDSKKTDKTDSSFDRGSTRNHFAKKDLKRSISTPQARGSFKLHLSTQFRILRCLLEAGASSISSTHLDMAIFQTLSVSLGQSLLIKLSRLVAEQGQPHVRSVLFSVLVTYRTTHDCLKCLLEAGADPRYYLTKEPSRPFMPMGNALLLLRVCNDKALLSRIECDTTGNLSKLNDQQIDQLLLVLRLLVVCGHSLQLYVMNFLQQHRLEFYMWVVRQRNSPPTLLSLARNKIRHLLRSNVLYCYAKLNRIPEELKQYLLLSEWLVPKKKHVLFSESG